MPSRSASPTSCWPFHSPARGEMASRMSSRRMAISASGSACSCAAMKRWSRRRTLTKADWAQSTIAGGDLAVEVSALKREPGKDLIAWGGAAFAQSLSRLRLVDEYRLVVQPVALGDGHPLFAGLTAPFVLDLIEARAYADGAVLHIYRPAAG